MMVEAALGGTESSSPWDKTADAAVKVVSSCVLAVLMGDPGEITDLTCNGGFCTSKQSCCNISKRTS